MRSLLNLIKYCAFLRFLLLQMNSGRHQALLNRRISTISLWDSDENDENHGNRTTSTQYSTPRAPDPATVPGNHQAELIDLTSPNLSPHGLKPLAYMPRTLKYEHQRRFSILPLFPMDGQATMESVEQVLLLANVPQQQLSIEQSIRRRLDFYPPNISMASTITADQSFFKQKYQWFFESIMDKWQIGMRILDFNYVRLQQVLQLFGETRGRLCNPTRVSVSQWQLNEEEYPAMLEFYLQMDVDLFYMKTCSFRQVQPKSTKECLFCQQAPECHHALRACGYCELCRSSSTSIEFDRYHRHRFVNGYEAILNCPATCSSTNIIYVLTCPCGQFDYVGESSQALAPSLRRHRQLGNLFMHEFLIGEKNRQRAQGVQQSSEMASKSRMRLYQHSIRCSVVVQLFLNANPQYWPFVPLLEEDARRQNQHYSTGRDPSIEERLKFVPVPPQGYLFSRRQLAQQYEYFARKLDCQQPSERLNLYHANIIALLPMNASDTFRQVIHALFVTHSESKLNTLGHLLDSNGQSSNLHVGIWCEHLVRPLRSTQTTTAMHS